MGWQVNTPTPDDLLGIAMSGDDANPAIPGYDPDISAELYTTNGEVDSYFVEKYGSFGFTPEMSTCEDASDSVPDDEWVAEDCGSGFEFPDDEDLIQAEFEKNIPFALAVAESAKDPDDPVSVVGRKAPDFEVDSFDVSYGDPQTVAVTAKRAIKQLQLNYKINNGKTKTASVSEWKGGETYGGDENDHYYAEFRGQVKGTRAGDKVKVWFSGEKKDGRHDDDVESAAFTYTVKGMGAKVLVIADEDYNGVNPSYPEPDWAAAPVRPGAPGRGPRGGLQRRPVGCRPQGVPHDLGVLSHYKAVVWYLGDNHITQDREDVFTSTPFGDLLDLSVAEREQYLTLAVRDFLNEGGKLIHAARPPSSRASRHQRRRRRPLLRPQRRPDGGVRRDDGRGLLRRLPAAGERLPPVLARCVRPRQPDVAPDFADGIAQPITGYHGELAGTPTNPLDEAACSSRPATCCRRRVPAVRLEPGRREVQLQGSPFAPIEGTHFAGALHQDESYMRLQRTIDLTGVTAADAPNLQFQLSYNTEPGFDNVIVEAHTSGADNWTTLPDANGGRRQPAGRVHGQGLPARVASVPAPLPGRPATAAAAGTSGGWNSFTGSSQGWKPVKIDLRPTRASRSSWRSATSPTRGGAASARSSTTRSSTSAARRGRADGFEGATSGWTVGRAARGQPAEPRRLRDRRRRAGVVRRHGDRRHALLGFGLEQVAAPADRTKLVKQALSGLGVR